MDDEIAALFADKVRQLALSNLRAAAAADGTSLTQRVKARGRAWREQAVHDECDRIIDALLRQLSTQTPTQAAVMGHEK